MATKKRNLNTNNANTTAKMTSKSISWDQNQNQGRSQNQIGTRSRLALPEFNVEYDRSPLKNAREALRRANARYGKAPTTAGTSAGDGPDGKVDAKMTDVLARVNTNASSNPFRRDTMKKGEEEVKEKAVAETGEATVEISERLPRENDGSSSMLKPATNPFDFSAVASDEHPKYPKRARSASFDENTPPSPSGSDRNIVEVVAARTTPPASPSRRSVTINPTAEPDLPPPISDSIPTMDGASNAKRVKLGKQGTLDTFFTQTPSSSSSSSSQLESKQLVPPRLNAVPPCRVFSEASPGPSAQSNSTVTPPQSVKPPQVRDMIVHPKTPTLKQLRELPTLDLRTITSSPRKPALKLGLGTPGPKRPPKARAVSEGAALLFARTKEEEVKVVSVSEAKEESKGAASEPREDGVNAKKQQSQSPPSPLPPPQEKAESQSTDVNIGSHPPDNEGAEVSSAADSALPSITVSTSTTTIAYSGSPVPEPPRQLSDPPAEAAEAVAPPMTPLPSTPLHKILSSRPLPSGHPPSTKAHLSNLLSLSPLTPLSALEPPRHSGDQYDYEEEERVVREENKRVANKEAAKLAMQEEVEVEDISASPKQIVAFSIAGPSKVPSPAPKAITRKASTKGKAKTKRLSSTSRAVTGVAGIKKRKSVISGTGTTPRMRMTRASVLRQKAIQAQIRTPKDAKKRRSSTFGTKNVTSAVREGDGEKKDKEPVKAGSSQEGTQKSDQKKQAEPEPQKSRRKTFVLTVPSSLSPRKHSSASSSANSSITLKSTPFESGPSKPLTFSVYPPPLNDTATTEQAHQALSKLSSALDKLAMPPPSKPNSLTNGAQLKRPMSEQRQRIRPATSLGFTREMSVPVSGMGSKEIGRPRAASRAGSAEPMKRSFFPPPPPPAFGSSLLKDKGKGKALANSSRTAPVPFGSSGAHSGVHGQMRPPSSFRFGLGPRGRGTTGIFGRPIPRMRASQKTSLETVQGSPVKGGDQPQRFAEDEEDEIVPADNNNDQRDTGAEADTSASSSNANDDTSVSSVDGTDTPSDRMTNVNGKELKRISKLNASRRASMAFTTLAQSLGTSPDMFSPFGPKDANVSNVPSDDKTPTNAPGNDKMQSVNAPPPSATNRPVRAAAPRSFGFGALGLGRMQSESSVHPNTRARSVTPSGVSESDSDCTARNSNKKSGGSMGRTKMPGSLDVLDQCIVFVDVRTDEGEDAGALFVDMLRGLGAKVLTRVGQTCTHIVYKNGLTSTLTRYRLLDEPRPKVVGIGWVVECAEKRARVVESRFQVDLESVNVAGTLKRRRSFLPKQISSAYSSGPMDAFLNGSAGVTNQAVHPAPKVCAESDVTSEDGDTSQERMILSGGSLGSDIHPLERARRRGVMPSR